jgi:hypothetical protein
MVFPLSFLVSLSLLFPLYSLSLFHTPAPPRIFFLQIFLIDRLFPRHRYPDFVAQTCPSPRPTPDPLTPGLLTDPPISPPAPSASGHTIAFWGASSTLSYLSIPSTPILHLLYPRRLVLWLNATATYPRLPFPHHRLRSSLSYRLPTAFVSPRLYPLHISYHQYCSPPFFSVYAAHTLPHLYAPCPRLVAHCLATL